MGHRNRYVHKQKNICNLLHIISYPLLMRNFFIADIRDREYWQVLFTASVESCIKWKQDNFLH